jgi:hypothetical protein
MARKDEPTRDARGMYRRDIGYKSDGKGRYSQHRFYLGRNRDEALLRSLQLEKVWKCVETRWEREGQPREGRPRVCWGLEGGRLRVEGRRLTRPMPTTPRVVWDDVSLQIAQAVARGEAMVRLTLPPVFYVADDHENPGDPQKYQEVRADAAGPATKVVWLRQLQADFVHVRLELVDQADQAQGEQVLEERFCLEVEAARKVLETANLPAPRGQTLHQALDAYSDWVKKNYLAPGGDGRVSQHGVTMLTYVGMLKEHHADMSLNCFGLAELDAMLTYWRNRPKGKRNRPIALDTARDMIKRVRHFVKWLHRSPAFQWRKPEDWEDGPIRVSLTHDEKSRKLNPAQVETYTLDELCVLYEYATPWERVLMLFALNCGFGRGEIESLTTREIHLRMPHGHYDRTGSWIKRLRYKSTVYGEWSLWDETVQAVEWLLARRGKTDHPALLLTETGRPLSEPTAGNNRNNKIPNAWAKLLARVRKDRGDFRKLSFNKLRKTAGNLVRKSADGETASIFLSHGTPCRADDLLDLYTDRDFAKVFLALDAVRKHLASMFSKVAVPFPAADAKEERPSLSRVTINKIRQLRQQGNKVSKIATEVGVSEGTVRRYCRGRKSS